MIFFTLKHDKLACYASFVRCSAAVLALTEYMLHRFVLRGLSPFSRWHAAHHDQPTALVCTPTVLSAALTTVLVFMPALLLEGHLLAFALTVGVVSSLWGALSASTGATRRLGFFPPTIGGARHQSLDTLQLSPQNGTSP